MGIKCCGSDQNVASNIRVPRWIVIDGDAPSYRSFGDADHASRFQMNLERDNTFTRLNTELGQRNGNSVLLREG